VRGNLGIPGSPQASPTDWWIGWGLRIVGVLLLFAGVALILLVIDLVHRTETTLAVVVAGLAVTVWVFGATVWWAGERLCKRERPPHSARE
jgi:hypothetical protein